MLGLLRLENIGESFRAYTGFYICELYVDGVMKHASSKLMSEAASYFPHNHMVHACSPPGASDHVQKSTNGPMARHVPQGWMDSHVLDIYPMVKVWPNLHGLQGMEHEGPKADPFLASKMAPRTQACRWEAHHVSWSWQVPPWRSMGSQVRAWSSMVLPMRVQMSEMELSMMPMPVQMSAMEVSMMPGLEETMMPGMGVWMMAAGMPASASNWQPSLTHCMASGWDGYMQQKWLGLQWPLHCSHNSTTCWHCTMHGFPQGTATTWHLHGLV